MGSILKKAGALATALVLACALAPAAFADNASLPPDQGTLTIHKYLMPDVSQAGNPNDGNELSQSQLQALTDAGAKPLGGIKFDIYRISKSAGGDYPGAAPYRLNAGKTQMTDAAGHAFDVTLITTLTTGPDGATPAQTLDQGYYLAVEQPDDRVTSPAEPYVVPVPMTNATGDGWITNVHAYPKNESSSTDKEVVSPATSVSVGDKITWAITPSVPSDVWTDIASENLTIAYSVTDAFDVALDYVAGSVKVQGMTERHGALTDIAEAGNYTVNYDGPSRTLTVSFTPDGRKLLHDKGYKFLSITVDTTVNAQLLDGNHIAYTIENQAETHFTNKNGEEKKTVSGKPSVHSGAIAIDKVDATSGNKLPGAKFKIASSEENAKNAHYLRKDAEGKIIDYGEAGYDAATDYEVETSGNGAAKFEGLADYTASITRDPLTGKYVESNKQYLSYWLVETFAPAGFNLLDAPVKVSFTEDSSTTGTSYTITAQVKNTNGFTLPKTGGAGTIAFTVGGIALLGVGAFILLGSRKKKDAGKK